MIENSNIKVTISFNNPELESEDLEDQAQKLLVQLKDLDEIETVGRVLDPNPPKGSKAIGAFLIGLLTATVNPDNFKKLMNFLVDRLGNKVIELEIEANGKKLKVKASSQAELVAAIEVAQKFIAQQDIK
jgi:hypothetical protein